MTWLYQFDGKNSLFIEYKYAKIPLNPVIFVAKTLIFIILKLTFRKKKKKMLGLGKNSVIIILTKNN